MSAHRKTKVSCRWLPDASAQSLLDVRSSPMKLRVDVDAQVLLCYGLQGDPTGGEASTPSARALSLRHARAALLPGSDRIVGLWAADAEAQRFVPDAAASSGDRPAAPVEGVFNFKCSCQEEAGGLLDRIQQAGCVMRGLGRRYDMQQHIGSGGFSKVFSAVDKLTGATVAIKLCSHDVQKKALHPLREAALLRQLRHPNILEFKGVYQVLDPEIVRLSGTSGGSTWALVTELLHGQELHRVALTRDITEVEARRHAYQLLSALHLVHQLGIIHRDVKPENVLVTPNGVKLIDFGVACREDDAESLACKVGSAGYVAPELLQRSPDECTVKMDTFAMGSLLYFVLRKRTPFDGDKSKTVFDNNMEGNVDMKSLKGLSAGAVDLILLLLNSDHEDRPSALAALRHPWLSRAWASCPATPARPRVRPPRPLREERVRSGRRAAR